MPHAHPLRPLLLRPLLAPVVVLALTVAAASASPAPDTCWSTRVTPGGHYFQVRFVPMRPAIATEGRRPNSQSLSGSAVGSSPLEQRKDCPKRLVIDERLASLR